MHPRLLCNVAGVNPFEGCQPSVPEGEKLDFGGDDFRAYERMGGLALLLHYPCTGTAPAACVERGAGSGHHKARFSMSR